MGHALINSVTVHLIILIFDTFPENAAPGNFTCRNDSSIELPLAYLCEGAPPYYEDGYYRKKRGADGYEPYFYIDCPDGSDESEETCGKALLVQL